MTIEFDDGKDAGAMRTIGEVSSAVDIKPHVLRYWEQQFPMLKPLKRSGSRRYYRARDVAMICEIDRLVNREGYTIKGAKKALAKWKIGDTTAEGAAQAAVVSEKASVFFSEADRDRGDAGKQGESEHELIKELKTIRTSLSRVLE